MNALLNEQLRSDFDRKTREDYERLRQEHAARIEGKKLLPLDQARSNRTAIDWNSYMPPRPEFLGTRIYANPGSAPVTGAGDGVSLSRTCLYAQLPERASCSRPDVPHSGQAQLAMMLSVPGTL